MCEFHRDETSFEEQYSNPRDIPQVKVWTG
jgi:hypothetical protein